MIKTERTWQFFDVREMCIRHEYYTCGDCNSYAKMLDKVEKCKPTHSNIYKIAKDIVEHSDQHLVGEGNDAIESVMFFIEKECVNTFYSIQEV